MHPAGDGVGRCWNGARTTVSLHDGCTSAGIATSASSGQQVTFATMARGTGE